NRGDAEFRVAALRALQAIGPRAADYVPNVVAALGHPDERVRRAAAIVLGRLGPAAQAAEPALRRALNDKDAEVRKNASDALLDIPPTPSAQQPSSDQSRCRHRHTLAGSLRRDRQSCLSLFVGVRCGSTSQRGRLGLLRAVVLFPPSR